MRGVHVIEAQVPFVPEGMAMFPSPSDDRFEPLRVLAANRVMQANDPATPLQEAVQGRALVASDGARLSREHDQDIAAVELFRRGKVHAAIGLGAALVEQFLPLRQEAGMIMLPWAVRLGPSADENPQRLRGRRATIQTSQTNRSKQRPNKMGEIELHIVRNGFARAL